MGDHCSVQAHAVIESRVRLGARNLVGVGAVIGGAPQDFAHDESVVSEVVIGDNNTFREHVTIHRGSQTGTATTVGSGNYLMAGVHLAHNVSVGDRTVIANNCLLAGYASVGSDAVLGGGAVFHQFLRIGAMCMIRGGTAWSKDIPPYTVGERINSVCGINGIGMRRKGLSSAARADVKRAYRLVYRSELNVSQAMAAAGAESWSPEAAEFFRFVGERSKRGLCAGRRRDAGDPDGD